MRDDFAIFILTHQRPDRVATYGTLKRHGYTGRIYLVVDDLDPSLPEYRERFGDEVIVFNKREAAANTDSGNNFNDLRSVVYARNATFGIAKDLGLTCFMQLDDDYTAFEYRFDDMLEYKPTVAHNLDAPISALVRF